MENKISYTPIGVEDNKEINLIYFAEWAGHGSLFHILEMGPDPLYIKLVLFQIIYTLAVIQNEYPSWRHNDFLCQNILLQKHKMVVGNKINYQFKGNNFLVPAGDASVRFWDFDFSDCDEVKNDKVRSKLFDEDELGVSELHCPQYDLVTLFRNLFDRKYLQDIEYADLQDFLLPIANLEEDGLYTEGEEEEEEKGRKEKIAFKYRNKPTDIFHQALSHDMLTSLAQRNLDKFDVQYINKKGKTIKTTLNKITAELLLLDSQYFNEFRVNSMAGIKVSEKYHYP